MLRIACAASLFALVACHPGESGSSSSSSGSGSGSSSGTTGGSSSSGMVDSGPVDMILDGGVHDAGPIDAPGFGPFTGTYTINGGGLLVAAQIDGHVALLLGGEPNAYLGIADAGRLDGGRPFPDAGRLTDGGHLRTVIDEAELFRTEIEYPALETCGPETLNGVFNATRETYTAENDLCTAGSAATVDFPGSQLIGDDFFRQDLTRSGVFDVTETPTASDTCIYPVAPPFHASIGFSVGLDGGPALVMVVGDGVLDEVDQLVDAGPTHLIASSLDVNGNPAGDLTLGSPTGSTWAGTRTFTYLPVAYEDGGLLDGGGSPCSASFALSGTKRTE